MENVKDDTRYKQTVAEDEGNTWRADTVIAPKIEAAIYAANKAAFIAEWKPVFATRRAAWNELVTSRPGLPVSQYESILGFRLADLTTAKTFLA